MKNALTTFLALILGSTLVAACGQDDQNGAHNDELDRIEIINRGDTDRPVVATWTHDGGWTGELPAISLSSTNQRVSLGVRAIAEDGDDLIAEDDHLEARYALATGATTGIIDTTRDDIFHGDHIHVYGLAEGTTQIQILLWHDDHADAETDPITVTVVE